MNSLKDMLNELDDWCDKNPNRKFSGIITHSDGSSIHVWDGVIELYVPYFTMQVTRATDIV